MTYVVTFIAGSLTGFIFTTLIVAAGLADREENYHVENKNNKQEKH